MNDNTILPFSFPAVARKKITAAFDGGRLTSDGGVMLLGLADRRIGVAEKLSIAFPERRDRSRVVHSLADMIRARNVRDRLWLRGRQRPRPSATGSGVQAGVRPAAGHGARSVFAADAVASGECTTPARGDPAELCAGLAMDGQLRARAECGYARHRRYGRREAGRQQLSFFNAYYDEYCFLPIHIYDTERSRPVAVVLRPGRVPNGTEVRAHLRRLVRHIRRRWPTTHITFQGDTHYACPEAMVFCERNSVNYIFGLADKAPLARKLDEVSDAICASLRSTTRRWYAAMPRPPTAQAPGIATGASLLASKPPSRGSIFAMSSPT